MKILHIVNYFSRQPLFALLVEKLSLHSISQYVYVPVRAQNEIGKNQNLTLKNIRYKYENILRPLDRIFYFQKINKCKRKLELWDACSMADIVHSHSLFSDGGIAYLLHTKHKKKYIVAVRGTDFAYLKFFPFLKGIAQKILENSERIIFINPAYKINFLAKFNNKNLETKSICMPNGIEDFWLENKSAPKQKKDFINLNLLYVGTFLKIKNLPLVIDTAIELSKTYNITLTLVGGGGRRTTKSNGDSKTLKAIEKGKKVGLNIQFLGKIKDRNKLKEIYQNADVFMMPSKSETFGLVYIESMSQGTPVIYTKNQGIDGFYEPGEVGFPVEKHTVSEMVNTVEKILADYDNMSKNCVNKVDVYNWENIAEKYIEIYKTITNRYDNSL